MAYIFITDITSMSKEVWRQERKKGIGGSDVGAILGVNKFRSVSDVYYDKIGAKMIRKETEKSKITLQIGNSLEEVVAEAFQDRYPSIEVHSDNAMYQHEAVLRNGKVQISVKVFKANALYPMNIRCDTIWLS